MEMRNRKIIAGSVLSLIFLLPISVLFAQEIFVVVEELLICTDVVVDKCYDGISYAYLIEQKVPEIFYPKDEVEFLLLKDSIENK